MLTNIFVAIVFFILGYFVFDSLIIKLPPALPSSQIGQNEDCLEIKFRFIEISHTQFTPVSRQIEVFLDNEAFNEENLNTLFKHLSKKNTDTKKLIITVSTNWKQLPLPFDCISNTAGLSDTSDQKPEKFEYHQARYFRDEKMEYFVYNPILKTDKFKKVFIKDNR